MEFRLPHAWYLFGYITSNEFLGLIYISLLVFIWRMLSVRWLHRPIQKFLAAKLGSYRIYVQWYSVFHFIMQWELFVALINIIMYDFEGFLLAEPRRVHVPGALVVVASLAPLANIAAFVIITVHLRRLVRAADAVRNIEKFRELDVIIACIMLPEVFGFLSMLAFSRLWQILTGNMKEGATEIDYLSLFQGDLALAVAAEFISIFAYANLVMKHYISSEECKGQAQIWGRPAVFWLTMNGVVLCVALGVVQNVCQVMELWAFTRLPKGKICGAAASPASPGLAPSWELFTPKNMYCFAGSIRESVDMLATGAVLLCAYNMFFVCSLPAVTQRLPRANLKFNGARLIVMLAQVQGKALLPVREYQTKHFMGLNGYNSALLHVVFSQIETLLICIFHFVIWNRQDDSHLKNDEDDTEDEDQGAHYVKLAPKPLAG